MGHKRENIFPNLDLDARLDELLQQLSERLKNFHGCHTTLVELQEHGQIVVCRPGGVAQAQMEIGTILGPHYRYQFAVTLNEKRSEMLGQVMGLYTEVYELYQQSLQTNEEKE